ncbi:RING-type domain-containing protein [Chloropicon primus]|uniref:RING-type domain-containing protein n=1 Tax=Chloropicon primus TaxID=1764295 RepID=A0A5B8MQG0_9CHLO|nr:hypothetical protein A3770_08p51550 [Chloropicon primus]UPR01860.1 RING-type domain-containing protein [Chloropicon primus]|eukprot:QDZ22637.1 hypothetical protein A3770_08p51550 [Chloropicon primus]
MASTSGRGLDDLAKQWLWDEGGGAGHIDELTATIDYQLGSLGEEIRRGKAKAKERTREREERALERKRVVGGAAVRGVDDEGGSDEEKMVRRMVARALVRSENTAKAERRNQELRLLDRRDVSTVVSNKVEVLLASCSQYVESVDDTCCICLDELKGGVLRLNRCKHQFHFLCILKWLELKQTSKCPLCKTDIGVVAE